jgi:hypothetical protein
MARKKRGFPRKLLSTQIVDAQAFTPPGIPAIFFLRGRGERPILMRIKRGYRFVG